MEITDAIINRSVEGKPFGTFEPFVTGNENDTESFYSRVLDSLEIKYEIGIFREAAHHGSGYASYISAFLFLKNECSHRHFHGYVETTGVLLYMSRLAPIAVFGASFRTQSEDGRSSSSGFIGIDNVGILPVGDCGAFLDAVRDCLRSFQIEILPRELLLQPAPEGVSIPTVFDGPYYVFDTLFYWSD